jgi:hypothetical protein
MQPEAVHLGDLLRIWVRPRARFKCLARIFKGRQEGTGHGKSCRALRHHTTLSPGKLIPGLGVSLQRKENSSQASRRRLRVQMRCRKRRQRPASPCEETSSHHQSPPLGSGILTGFPFGCTVLSTCTIAGASVQHHFRQPFGRPLGPTDPCSTAVHMEPFSSLVLKGLT